MPSILIQLDDATYRKLNKVAPAAKRMRTEFVRKAVKDAILRLEFDRTREAYLKQPDSIEETNDWSTWGEYKP